LVLQRRRFTGAMRQVCSADPVAALSSFQSTATKTIPGSIRSHKRVVRAALHCASRSCVLIALASPEPQ